MVCRGGSEDKMTASLPSRADPKVSVVIPNHNGAHWLSGCLEALAAQELRGSEVIVVDDGSTDGSAAILRERYPQVRLIALDRNTGFAAAVNVGIQAARGEHVALLNNDTVARPVWLGALVKTLENSPQDVGAVASKMLCFEDPHCVDDAGDALSWTGAAEKQGHGRPASEFMQSREVFSPCAGAALYRRSFLEATGGLDERFFAYLEDVDLGLRGRLLGYRYLFEPAAEVLHKGQGSEVTRARYVRLITRNRVMLFAKSVPFSLLFKHLPRLLYGQLYFFIAYRQPLQSLAGYGSLLLNVPHIFRERRRLAQSRRITPADFETMLSSKMSEPPLGNPLRYLWKRLRA